MHNFQRGDIVQPKEGRTIWKVDGIGNGYVTCSRIMSWGESEERKSFALDDIKHTMLPVRSLTKEKVMAKPPSSKALALAREQVVYNDSDPKALKVLGTRFLYNAEADAIDAESRMTLKLAEMLDDYAAEQQVLNSWDPSRMTKGVA